MTEHTTKKYTYPFVSESCFYLKTPSYPLDYYSKGVYIFSENKDKRKVSND